MIFNSYTLRLAAIHVAATLALVAQVLLGTATDWLVTLGVYTFVAVNLTMTYHRYLAHKAFEFKHAWMKYVSTVVCTVGSGFSSPLAWVAIHREHHRKSDKPNDPHLGNKLRYLPKLHLTSMFIEPKMRYVPDLMRDAWLVDLHQKYFYLHFMWTLLLIAFGGPWLAVIAYLTPLCLLWHAGNFVNSLSHVIGYRSYETKDDSRNNPLVALIFFGEWHNNHHAFPASARHGLRWWELDVTYWLIRLIGKEIKT